MTVQEVTKSSHENKTCKSLYWHLFSCHPRFFDSFSSNETDNWAADYGADKGMVFFSDFTVGDTTNTTLNPNSTYKDWQWYVIQTDAGDWSVVNQGQG